MSRTVASRLTPSSNYSQEGTIPRKGELQGCRRVVRIAARVRPLMQAERGVARGGKIGEVLTDRRPRGAAIGASRIARAVASESPLRPYRPIVSVFRRPLRRSRIEGKSCPPGYRDIYTVTLGAPVRSCTGADERPVGSRCRLRRARLPAPLSRPSPINFRGSWRTRRRTAPAAWLSLNTGPFRMQPPTRSSAASRASSYRP